MDLENIKRGLRAEIKKRENEQYSTFQTNIREMCKDVLDKLEEQESLIKEMREAAKRLGYTWQDYDAGEDACEDTHTGKWVKIGDEISNSVESNPPPKPVAFFDHRKEPDCTMEYQVYDKQEADAYIHWLEQKAGILC